MEKPEVPLQRRPMTYALWSAVFVLALVCAAIAWSLYHRIINPPDPLVFISTSLSQHEVIAGGHLTMTAVVEISGSPDCYTGATRIIRFSDRSEARIPGERRALGTGPRRTILYEMGIPVNAPSGPATVTIKEIFTCGTRIEVESPAIRFMIRGDVEPGIDRYYDGRRDE